MKPKPSPQPLDATSNGSSPVETPATPAAPSTRSKSKRSSSKGDAIEHAHEHDIMTTAAGSNRLKIFVDLAHAAGLTELLSGAGPFTVFAPTDRAFGKMKEGELDALMADNDRLAEVLGNHVVAGRVKAPKSELPRMATSIKGQELTLTSRIDAYRVNESRLVQTNIRASNGVIHAIDRLLVLR